MINRIINTPWHFMRWFRLIAGLFFAFGSIINYDLPVLLISIILLSQALFNWGCCNVNSCANTTNNKQKNGQEINNITYEEVK